MAVERRCWQKNDDFVNLQYKKRVQSNFAMILPYNDELNVYSGEQTNERKKKEYKLIDSRTTKIPEIIYDSFSFDNKNRKKCISEEREERNIRC